MNQRCEHDSKTNTETLEQMKSTSQPRRARPKTKPQAPTNLIKSFKSEASFSLKPELSASNRRGKYNSDQANHKSGSLSNKTSYISSIHTKWLSSWNDQKNHSAKQYSLIYTQGRHKILAPKSFVLNLILIPLNQYPVLGDVRDVTSSRLSHEQTQSNRVCCFPTLQFHCISEGSIFQIYFVLQSSWNS